MAKVDQTGVPWAVPEIVEATRPPLEALRAETPLCSDSAALHVLHDVRISVIIPCFNSISTIGVQLEALARQNWRGWWELIVVDNGSRDGTPDEVVRHALSLGFLRWRLLRGDERRGAAYARNVGAREARGNALAFADADDEMAPDWLAAMAEALQREEMVASRLEYGRLNDERMRRMRGQPQQQGIQAYRNPRFLPHATGAGLGVNRALHERLGGFDEDMLMLEDTDYCWRAQLGGARLAFASGAVMHYRLRPSVRASCRQARLWAEYNVVLCQRYRTHGVEPMLWRKELRVWRRLGRRGYELFDSARRPRWLWDFSWAWGRLRGALRYRLRGGWFA